MRSSCEGGTYLGQRGRGQAIDGMARKSVDFKANVNTVSAHAAGTFVDAVRTNNTDMLRRPDRRTGTNSTGWCNLANVAFRGRPSVRFRETKLVSRPAILPQVASDFHRDNMDGAGLGQVRSETQAIWFPAAVRARSGEEQVPLGEHAELAKTRFPETGVSQRV